MDPGTIFATAHGVEWDCGRRPPLIAPDLLSDQELMIYRALRETGVMTGGEIEMVMGNVPRTRIKKLINRLVLAGVVHKHRLLTQRAAIPFYGLGDLPIPRDSIQERTILKMLTCNLIYARLPDLRLLERWETRVDEPFNAVFSYQGITFHVAALREFPGELERLAVQLGWLKEEKVILIAPHAQLMQTAGEYLESRLQGAITYTSDPELLHKPLSQAFYFKTAEGMRPIHARLFDESPSVHTP